MKTIKERELKQRREDWVERGGGSMKYKEIAERNMVLVGKPVGKR
jgi:hypothetical protein